MNEKCRLRVRVANSAWREDVQLDDVADRRKHVTSSGHVIGQGLVAVGGADAGVDRIRALLDDGVATRGAGARRPRR